MNNYTLLLLLLAGTLLLFGCAGKYGAAKEKQQTTEVGGKVQPEGTDSASSLTESDLALFEDTDSAVELTDLPLDDGS